MVASNRAEKVRELHVALPYATDGRAFQEVVQPQHDEGVHRALSPLVLGFD